MNNNEIELDNSITVKNKLLKTKKKSEDDLGKSKASANYNGALSQLK